MCSQFCHQVCVALTNYDRLHLWACMSLFKHVCMSFAELKRSTAVEMVFSGALLPPLCLSECYSVGLKNVRRKHFCRHECSKYLFIEGFWNCWSAEHLLVALRQLADHVEQALLQTLSAYRMVSHAVLQGRYRSSVTANGSSELCISVEIQPRDKSIWELPF